VAYFGFRFHHSCATAGESHPFPLSYSSNIKNTRNLKRLVEPQNAQKSHKNQEHVLEKHLTDLMTAQFASTSCFTYVTYVLYVANR
jgi:hypothetical protein